MQVLGLTALEKRNLSQGKVGGGRRTINLQGKKRENQYLQETSRREKLHSGRDDGGGGREEERGGRSLSDCRFGK